MTVCKKCVFVLHQAIHTVSLGRKRGIPHFVAEYPKITLYYDIVFVQILLKITVEKALKCFAVSSFVTKTLENAVKTGIFNRLAQNQHKSTKIYTVDFSS